MKRCFKKDAVVWLHSKGGSFRMTGPWTKIVREHWPCIWNFIMDTLKMWASKKEHRRWTGMYLFNCKLDFVLESITVSVKRGRISCAWFFSEQASNKGIRSCILRSRNSQGDHTWLYICICQIMVQYCQIHSFWPPHMIIVAFKISLVND